jgi:hypothetical protein
MQHCGRDPAGAKALNERFICCNHRLTLYCKVLRVNND